MKKVELGSLLTVIKPFKVLSLSKKTIHTEVTGYPFIIVTGCNFDSSHYTQRIVFTFSVFSVKCCLHTHHVIETSRMNVLWSFVNMIGCNLT